MGFKVRDNVDVRDAESAETIRTPDGGTANVPAGDKVYTTEKGWVYHHPAQDEDGNDVTPDWEEVSKSHSNPALVEDLLEKESGESVEERNRPDQSPGRLGPDDDGAADDDETDPDREQAPTRRDAQAPRRRAGDR